MPTLEFELNGKVRSVEADSSTPMLWVLRDDLGLMGTKFGCGVGECGACTIHVDDVPRRSCLLPVAAVQGRRIRTIEGLADDGPHPVQAAWVAEQVPQCGYCQSGLLMTAAALLNRKVSPTDRDIDQAFRGHLCRCGTYARVRSAIHRAARKVRP